MYQVVGRNYTKLCVQWTAAKYGSKNKVTSYQETINKEKNELRNNQQLLIRVLQPKESSENVTANVSLSSFQPWNIIQLIFLELI